MIYRTHLIGGAQAGVLLAYANNGTPAETALIIGTALIGSMIPDIDNRNSRICRKDILIGFLSRMTCRVTVHRGITHTLPGALIFALIFYALGMLRTPVESIFALYGAILVFLLIHGAGGKLRNLGGLLAALTCVFGPALYGLAAERGIRIALDSRAAYLCSLGMLFGCISHMIYDTFNPGGIRWLWPLTKKTISIADIKTNSRKEEVFRTVQAVILMIMLAAALRDTHLMDMARGLLDTFSAHAAVIL